MRPPADPVKDFSEEDCAHCEDWLYVAREDRPDSCPVCEQEWN